MFCGGFLPHITKPPRNMYSIATIIDHVYTHYICVCVYIYIYIYIYISELLLLNVGGYFSTSLLFDKIFKLQMNSYL